MSLYTRAFLLAALPLAATILADEPRKPEPQTTRDAAVAPHILGLTLKPLTKDELLVEAGGWQELLKAKVREISDAEIRAASLPDAQRAAELERAAKAREERTQLIDRLNVVLTELRAKGGKSEEYDTYVGAVSGVTVRVTDARATYSAVVNWLKSPEGGIRIGLNLFKFIGTLVVFKILAAFLAGVTGRAMLSFKHVSHLLRDFVVNTTRKVIMFVGFVVALSMLEVNIGPFLAAMGAAGFVIAFALQGTLSNFASGVMILLYRPYDLGDTVTVAGTTGKVTSMTLVSTILTTADGHVVMIPNSSIWGGTITNLSSKAGG